MQRDQTWALLFAGEEPSLGYQTLPHHCTTLRPPCFCADVPLEQAVRRSSRVLFVHVSSGGHDLPGRVYVAALSHVHHRRPARRNDGARSAA